MGHLFCLKLTLLIYLSAWVLFYTGAFIYMLVLGANYSEDSHSTGCYCVFYVWSMDPHYWEYYGQYILGTTIFMVIAWSYELLKLTVVACEWRQVICIFAGLEFIFFAVYIVHMFFAFINSHLNPEHFIVFGLLSILDLVKIVMMFILASEIKMKKEQKQQQQKAEKQFATKVDDFDLQFPRF